jgi:hypothetical protein
MGNSNMIGFYGTYLSPSRSPFSMAMKNKGFFLNFTCPPKDTDSSEVDEIEGSHL